MKKESKKDEKARMWLKNNQVARMSIQTKKNNDRIT